MFLMTKTELIVWIELLLLLINSVTVLYRPVLGVCAFGCTHINAVVIIPNFDPRDVEAWGSFHIPDDKVQLDRRVERTRPHVTHFCGLNRNRPHANFNASIIIN